MPFGDAYLAEGLGHQCIECGSGFRYRHGLRQHWELAMHGPRQVQADAVDRLRSGLMDEETPLPKPIKEE